MAGLAAVGLSSLVDSSTDVPPYNDGSLGMVGLRFQHRNSPVK